MLQDFVQVDLLGTGVRKRCPPPFVHAPPPRPVVPHPRPRSHTLPLFPHLGAHRIPQPRFCTPPPLTRSTLRLGCTLPCSHTLRASAVCFPGCTAHRSVPLPFARGPLACGPPLTRGPFARGPLASVLPPTRGSFARGPLACGPPLTRGPFTRGPLACGPPLMCGPLCMALPLHAHPSLLRFRYARKRGGGRAGVVGHGGEVGHGGGGQPGWRGLPAHERGEAPSLVPPRHMCKGGGGRARQG